jgi:hypothetical protein
MMFHDFFTFKELRTLKSFIMKTLFKTKLALLVIVTGLLFSCKKNETVPADTYTDTTETMVDTVTTPIDTTTINADTARVKTDTTKTTTPK